MTEAEKKEIADMIYRRLEADWKPPVRCDTQTKLANVRNKWFRDANGSGYESLMTQVVGSSQNAWAIWETIRGLTCKICRVSYVRHLNPEHRAEEAAEELCALVYKLVQERANG